jgi:ABC-type multidrug transport system ATPase subunit
MRKAEIARKFDEIVEFSGCARYIDTPVKRYSSGMYVRLAFAVAAHLEPEILIVDEVLAVGDAEFQKKCLGKMKDVAGHGRTILFVSHNMAAVSTLTERSVVLQNGQVAFVGKTEDAINQYLAGSKSKESHYISEKAKSDFPSIRSINVECLKKGITTFVSGSDFECSFEVYHKKPILKITLKYFLSIILLLIIIPILTGTYKSDFVSEQKRHPRVHEAIKKKEPIIRQKLYNYYIGLDELNVMMVAYKSEKRLDVFVKKQIETRYRLFQSYPICDISGNLGPKRKRGDLQTPEGFYYIDAFNPSSSYHLSFRINYPNLSDKRKSNSQDLGGDIFIHGSCATIGCLPMTDNIMEEITY